MAPDLEDLHRPLRPELVVDDHHVVVAEHRRPRPPRLCGARVPAQTIERAPQLVRLQVGVAELEQGRTEAVLAGSVVLADQPAALEGPQQGVTRWAWPARVVRRPGDAQRRAPQHM